MHGIISSLIVGDSYKDCHLDALHIDLVLIHRIDTTIDMEMDSLWYMHHRRVNMVRVSFVDIEQQF